MIALTHLPSPRMDEGLRTHCKPSAIDHARALTQHRAYCAMLSERGTTVRTLDVNRDFPDSTFIEDTAVVLDEVAVMASMGTDARRREVPGIASELRRYRVIETIAAENPLEGGDVLRVGRTLLVGISSRTSEAGIRALEQIVHRHGYQVRPVPVKECLHLKTACTALPDQSLLVNPRWVALSDLSGFEIVCIPEAEPWAANSLLLGSNVCIAAAHPRTADLLRTRGFKVRTVDVSEFAKAEGGLTCLSLLIENAPLS
jgi:dimethylargininase